MHCFQAALERLGPSSRAPGALPERRAPSVASRMLERDRDGQLLERSAVRPTDAHLPDLHGLDARFFEREYVAVSSELGKLPQAATQEAIEGVADACTAALEVLVGSTSPDFCSIPLQ